MRRPDRLTVRAIPFPEPHKAARSRPFAMIHPDRKEEKTNTLFFDNDYWVMSPELGFVNYEDFRVEDLMLTPERRAAVTFTIYHSDSYVPARIDMVYEDGSWVIDDFEDLKYIKSWKEGMAEFVKEKNRE